MQVLIKCCNIPTTSLSKTTQTIILLRELHTEINNLRIFLSKWFSWTVVALLEGEVSWTDDVSVVVVGVLRGSHSEPIIAVHSEIPM